MEIWIDNWYQIIGFDPTWIWKVVVLRFQAVVNCWFSAAHCPGKGWLSHVAAPIGPLWWTAIGTLKNDMTAYWLLKTATTCLEVLDEKHDFWTKACWLYGRLVSSLVFAPAWHSFVRGLVVGWWPRVVSLWTYYFEESASSTTSSWSLQKSLPQCFYRSILEAVEFEWLGGWVWTGATVNSSKSTQVFRFKNAAPQPNGDRFNAIPQFRWQWSRHLRRHLRFGSGQRNGSLTTNIGR